MTREVELFNKIMYHFNHNQRRSFVRAWIRGCGFGATIFLYASFGFLGDIRAQGQGATGFETLEMIPPPIRQEVPDKDLPMDHALKSTLTGVAAFTASWKSEHFVSYLLGMNLLAGLAVGFMVSFAAHFSASPHSRWKDVTRKTTLLAAACGAGMGIVLVTTAIPVPSHGKLTYLLAAVSVCLVSAALVNYFFFVIVRKIKMAQAQKNGFYVDTESMCQR